MLEYISILAPCFCHKCFIFRLLKYGCVVSSFFIVSSISLDFPNVAFVKPNQASFLTGIICFFFLKLIPYFSSSSFFRQKEGSKWKNECKKHSFTWPPISWLVLIISDHPWVFTMWNFDISKKISLLLSWLTHAWWPELRPCSFSQ